ncbi:MAG TPA: hypothetical protein VIG90_00855 [Pedomonas sp.]|uniref:hypothetical protein n=1 Tax=Pedomonas sp. TaxID=2976421 RepID=UPI002F40B5BD
MDWETTIGAFVVVALITLWANIASRRPRRLGRVPLIPPDVIQLIGLIALFILGAHLITLYRGEPLNIRSRF